MALGTLHPSPTQPRKNFAEEPLREMAETMRTHGVLLPLLTRWSPWETGKLEIIDGERRFRAARMAGLSSVPVSIVEMSDIEVREAQFIANIQREALSEIEEAEGFRALIEQGGKVGGIAAKVGKSKEFVYGRLALLKLVPEARKALEAGEVMAGHAILLARLQAAAQRRALLQAADSGCSVRALDDWIDARYRLVLAAAPFPLADATLDAKAGPCEGCAKRDQKKCFDPDCYAGKVQALIARRVLARRAKGEETLLLSIQWGTPAWKGALSRAQYELCSAGQWGIYVDGDRLGQVVSVRRTAAPQARKAAEAEKQKREAEKAARERMAEATLAIAGACVQAIKAPLDTEDLRSLVGMLADVVYPESSWVFEVNGLNNVNGVKIDTPAPGVMRDAIRTMKPQALVRLLASLILVDVVSASSGSLDPHLAALAKRHGVEAQAMLAKAGAK